MTFGCIDINFLSQSKNISQWIHASSKALTLSWRRFLSYRNQSIDLFCKSMNWFLYNMASIIKDSRRSSSTYTESLFLHVVKHNLLFLFLFFFSIWLFFYEYSRFTGQQVKGEAISSYPFYHFHPLLRHLDISWVIAAESWPLRIAGSWNKKVDSLVHIL